MLRNPPGHRLEVLIINGILGLRILHRFMELQEKAVEPVINVERNRNLRIGTSGIGNSV